MSGERPGSEDEETFPPGERASPEDDPAADDPQETYPAGVETDEGQRPGDKLEDEQPGLLDEPPRAD